jgi:hypothetical protein
VVVEAALHVEVALFCWRWSILANITALLAWRLAVKFRPASTGRGCWYWCAKGNQPDW